MPLCISDEVEFHCSTNGTFGWGRLACMIDRQESNFERAA